MPKLAQNPSRVWYSPVQLPAGDAPIAGTREADMMMGHWEGAAGHSTRRNTWKLLGGKVIPTFIKTFNISVTVAGKKDLKIPHSSEGQKCCNVDGL